MKRIMLAFVVVAVLAMLIPSVAMAKGGKSATAPNSYQGISKAIDAPGSAHRSDVAADKLSVNLAKSGNAPA